MHGLNHVEPGGAPLVVRLSPAVTMTKVSVGGAMDNNAYLLQARGGGTVLVDAANDSQRLLKLIGAAAGATPSSPPTGTPTTGRRWRRWPSAPAPGWSRAGPMPTRSSGRPGSAASSGSGTATRSTLGEESLAVIGLVGHTPGSITLAYAGGGVPHLFTGDSLFPGGPGRTHVPEDFTSLMDDLERKVFDAFGDDAVVHPGHGDDTTLGAERPHLPEWRRRGW